MSEFKMASNKRSRGKLHALTSLRFFAASCIFILHATNHALLPASFASYFDLSKAVSFFFVLSGFVLAYAYVERPFKNIDFYLARFARVWPVTAFSTIFVLILLPRFIYLPNIESSWSLSSALFVNLTFLQAFFFVPSIFFGLNAVTWSVSVEAFFYVLFPYFNKNGLKRSFLLFLLVSTLVLAGSAVVDKFEVADFANSNYDNIVWQGLVYINPLMRLPEFLVGIVFAKLFVSFRSRNYFPKIVPFAALRQPFCDFLEIFLFIVFVWLGFKPPVYVLDGAFSVAFAQIISGICFAIVIFLASNSSGLLSKFLGIRLFRFLGEISFGIYLFHQPIMIKAAQLKGISIAGVQILSDHIFSVMASCLVLSIISFYFLEQPAQRLLRPRMSAKPNN